MQPVFFISLFSLIFLMFSSMTAGLSKNIMQANIERVRETKDMFSQVEIAINKVAFKEKYTPTGSSAELPIVDLSRSDLTDLSGDFLAGHTSYTSSQLSKDMWGQKIYLFRVIDRESLWSGGAGEIAEAPVSTIMLISAGPNRRYDTLTNSGMDLKNLDMADARIKTIDLTDIAVIGDDVVVRFNNYEAMLDLWQKAENLDDIIKNVALDHYKTRLDAFSPLIQLAQRDVTDGMLGNDVFDDLDSAIEYDPFAKLGTDDAALVNEWNDPSSPVHALLIEYSGSPTRDGFRKKAKEYENEFRLAPKNFNDDGSFKNDDDNIALNKEFTDKYKNVKFQYPSFDIVIKDKNGNTLSPSEQGLQNLGFTNLYSLDPFAGLDGEVIHGYSESKPERLKIVRKIDSGDNEKWKIIKNTEINGLGEL